MKRKCNFITQSLHASSNKVHDTIWEVSQDRVIILRTKHTPTQLGYAPLCYKNEKFNTIQGSDLLDFLDQLSGHGKTPLLRFDCLLHLDGIYFQLDWCSSLSDGDANHQTKEENWALYWAIVYWALNS